MVIGEKAKLLIRNLSLNNAKIVVIEKDSENNLLNEIKYKNVGITIFVSGLMRELFLEMNGEMRLWTH